MVNNYDLRQIKTRFGALLTSLHDTGFTDEYITHSIITNPYFDMFENNDLSNFDNNSVMNIVEKQFNKDPMISFSSNLIAEYIWAGEIYITVMLNYRIPLKQLFVICPLGKMIECFPLYHEMHNIEICKEILKLRKQVSILKHFRSETDMSIRQLSLLSGISQPTLVSYENDNQLLFSASSNNIMKLKEALNIPLSCMQRESTFIPFTSILFDNDSFKKSFITNLLQYNKCEGKDYVVVNEYQDEKEYKNILKSNGLIVSLCLSFVGTISMSSNRVSYKMLNDKELLLLYSKTIKELHIEDCPLIF